MRKYSRAEKECLICNRKTRNLGYHITKTHRVEIKDYYDTYLKKDSEGICVNCGKNTTFRDLSRGYYDFCSKDCVDKSPVIKEKKVNTLKSTMMKMYGYDNASKVPSIREKQRKTCIEIYGVSNPLGSKDVRERATSTIEKRWGVRSPIHSTEIANRIKATNFDRYGYVYTFQAPSIKKKIKQTNLNKYGVPWYIMSEDFKSKVNYRKSSLEKEVLEYIYTIYNKEDIMVNNFATIYPYQLDIYIPRRSVAIECNGIYWHSINSGTDKDYHLMKSKLCEDKRIRLIHISEWEWKNKKEICQSIISSALGVYKERIYARNCEVREVDSKIAKEFLELNHIQGNVYSSYRLGLFYKDELVQIITLGSSRFKKGETELLRMCSKLNTQVIGGFSKLIKYFPKEIKEVYSYIDRGKFDGKGYFSTGWEYISETAPNYHYYKGIERFSRNQCQKYKLKKFLGEENYDESLTETENMMKNNYLKVYDSGNIKVKLRRNDD